MCAIVINAATANCLFSFMFGYTCMAVTHCSWQHRLFAEPSSLHRKTCVCWDVSRRIQRSDDYDKPLRHCCCEVLPQTHPAVKPRAWVKKEDHTPYRALVGCSSPFLWPWARRWINHYISRYCALSYNYAMRFRTVLPCVSIYLFLRFRKLYFCVFMTFFNWCVAFS